MLIGVQEKMSVQIKQKRELTAPVKEGTSVGMLTYSVGDFTAAEYRILTAEVADSIDYLYCIMKCAELFCM